MSVDRRERPWQKIRVIVEVTVPPITDANERELALMVRQALPRTLKFPRRINWEITEAVVKVKSFSSFWPAFLRKEKGLPINFKKKPKPDPHNGL